MSQYCENCKQLSDKVEFLNALSIDMGDTIEVEQKALQEIFNATAYPGATIQQYHQTIIRINQIAGAALIGTRGVEEGER